MEDMDNRGQGLSITSCNCVIFHNRIKRIIVFEFTLALLCVDEFDSQCTWKAYNFILIKNK